jgi:hypothetical protein
MVSIDSIPSKEGNIRPSAVGVNWLLRPVERKSDLACLKTLPISNAVLAVKTETTLAMLSSINVSKRSQYLVTKNACLFDLGNKVKRKRTSADRAHAIVMKTLQLRTGMSNCLLLLLVSRLFSDTRKISKMISSRFPRPHQARIQRRLLTI